MIPVQIGGVFFIRVFPQKTQRKCCLADLPRAADEHHFLLQGLSDGVFQVTWDTHEMDYSPLCS